MFGKIENGRLVIAGQKIKIENGWITNPTQEQLRANGYKGLCYNPKPDYDKEEEKLIETYTEEEVRIVISYETVALTKDEKIEIIKQEIIDKENKITTRNYRNAIMGDNYALNILTEVEGNIAELRAKLRAIQEAE